MNDKNAFQEVQIVELKNSLFEHEKDNEIISNLKAEKKSVYSHWWIENKNAKISRTDKYCKWKTCCNEKYKQWASKHCREAPKRNSRKIKKPRILDIRKEKSNCHSRNKNTHQKGESWICP